MTDRPKNPKDTDVEVHLRGKFEEIITHYPNLLPLECRPWLRVAQFLQFVSNCVQSSDYYSTVIKLLDISNSRIGIEQRFNILFGPSPYNEVRDLDSIYTALLSLAGDPKVVARVLDILLLLELQAQSVVLDLTGVPQDEAIRTLGILSPVLQTTGANGIRSVPGPQAVQLTPDFKIFLESFTPDLPYFVDHTAIHLHISSYTSDCISHQIIRSLGGNSEGGEPQSLGTDTRSYLITHWSKHLKAGGQPALDRILETFKTLKIAVIPLIQQNLQYPIPYNLFDLLLDFCQQGRGSDAAHLVFQSVKDVLYCSLHTAFSSPGSVYTLLRACPAYLSWRGTITELLEFSTLDQSSLTSLISQNAQYMSKTMTSTTTHPPNLESHAADFLANCGALYGYTDYRIAFMHALLTRIFEDDDTRLSEDLFKYLDNYIGKHFEATERNGGLNNQQTSDFLNRLKHTRLYSPRSAGVHEVTLRCRWSVTKAIVRWLWAQHRACAPQSENSRSVGTTPRESQPLGSVYLDAYDSVIAQILCISRNTLTIRSPFLASEKYNILTKVEEWGELEALPLPLFSSPFQVGDGTSEADLDHTDAGKLTLTVSDNLFLLDVTKSGIYEYLTNMVVSTGEGVSEIGGAISGGVGGEWFHQQLIVMGREPFVGKQDRLMAVVRNNLITAHIYHFTRKNWEGCAGDLMGDISVSESQIYCTNTVDHYLVQKARQDCQRVLGWLKGAPNTPKRIIDAWEKERQRLRY